MTANGLIEPSRGLHNEILLSPQEESLLRRFRRIEQNEPKLSLDLCLERLRIELTREALDTARARVEHLEAENTALRRALVVYRRWRFSRILERVRARWRAWRSPTG